MSVNYEKIIRENLGLIYDRDKNPESILPALRRGKEFFFHAFGEECRLKRDGITFSERIDIGPKALLVSLYALHGNPDPVRPRPFRSFRDFPGSMPYQEAFASNSERVLLPHVPKIREKASLIVRAFDGERDPECLAGDFSFLIYPLPKVGLCYIFYLADEEFPPSVTCLFSSNALSFMPLDGLADVAEYTAREMIHLVQ